MAFDRIFCPVCSDAVFTPLADNPPAVRCTTCGLGIETLLSRNPSTAYERPTYDAARVANLGTTQWARFHHDTAVANDRLIQLAAILPTHPVKKVWVDVGCSNGAFLCHARRLGWSAVGVEADPASAREVTGLLGLGVMDFGAWMALAQNQPAWADVISFNDVLEHLLDPIGTLIAAAVSLVPGGLVVIEVPDLDAAEDFTAWKHRRVQADFTEHIWHFCAQAFEAIRSRFLPNFSHVHLARPVAGRMQLAWRKDEDKKSAAKRAISKPPSFATTVTTGGSDQKWSFTVDSTRATD